MTEKELRQLIEDALITYGEAGAPADFETLEEAGIMVDKDVEGLVIIFPQSDDAFQLTIQRYY
jgi:hypothetical protein